MLDGILPLWKEKGMTSHDCVFRLRKILGMKRIGHTGTLDPDVEGVLPICLGRATKTAEYVMDMGKTYEAVVSIGRSTETEDASGATVEENLEPKCFTDSEIRTVLRSLTGEITQIPPMYSAVKVNGKRLYEYARQGQFVDRPSRRVFIRQIELLSGGQLFEGTEVEFRIRVVCGKGTYIRTLAVQIGEKLGFPAHMASLVRTASGPFKAEDCLTLGEVEQQRERGTLEAALVPIERALSEFPAVPANEILPKIRNGQVLPAHPLLAEHQRIVYYDGNRAVAIYRCHPEKKGLMKPEKMLGMAADKR